MAETKGRIMLVTFADVYEKLCERYPDPGERGSQFKHLVAAIQRQSLGLGCRGATAQVVVDIVQNHGYVNISRHQ